MEREEIYELMMDALDGNLSDNGRIRLEQLLEADEGAAREWHAMNTIDALFRGTPALVPAADFTQRTLARLPNSSVRRWVLIGIYLFLLCSGILPLLFMFWLFGELSPLGQSSESLAAVGRALWAALLQGVTNFGDVIGDRPAIAGVALMMVGSIYVWNGVYRRLWAEADPIGTIRNQIRILEG